MSEGRIAARVFYLFDHGRELREVVQEAEVPPSVVRELWHEWMTDLQEGELERRKTTQEERRLRREQEEMRELERRSEQEQKNFETDDGFPQCGCLWIRRQVGRTCGPWRRSSGMCSLKTQYRTRSHGNHRPGSAWPSSECTERRGRHLEALDETELVRLDPELVIGIAIDPLQSMSKTGPR